MALNHLEVPLFRDWAGVYRSTWGMAAGYGGHVVDDSANTRMLSDLMADRRSLPWFILGCWRGQTADIFDRRRLLISGRRGCEGG